MKNIVLVGPDGSGKSTLAQDLSRVFTMPVYHGMGSHNDKVRRTHEILNWSTPVILDRVYPIDELVYASALGFEAESKAQLTSLLKPFKNPRDYVVVYVDNVFAERVLEVRGDKTIEVGDIEAIRTAYVEFFKRERFENVIFTPMNFDQYDAILTDLINTITGLNNL